MSKLSLRTLAGSIPHGALGLGGLLLGSACAPAGAVETPRNLVSTTAPMASPSTTAQSDRSVAFLSDLHLEVIEPAKPQGGANVPLPVVNLLNNPNSGVARLELSGAAGHLVLASPRVAIAIELGEDEVKSVPLDILELPVSGDFFWVCRTEAHSRFVRDLRGCASYALLEDGASVQLASGVEPQLARGILLTPISNPLPGGAVQLQWLDGQGAAPEAGHQLWLEVERSAVEGKGRSRARFRIASNVAYIFRGLERGDYQLRVYRQGEQGVQELSSRPMVVNQVEK